ncbi:MAG: isoleucine--tRNA ligase [Proteobacteria bacterium]|nr:isoleucine--tRNA ligase [Pseudomonadota bacterium]
MPYKPYPKTEARANFPELERQILSYWRDHDIFHKTRKQSAAIKPRVDFSFYDGPPTPSSKPHVGHLGVSAVKDMVVRFHTMLGQYVTHQFGWDVHGLPTEVTVEKQTGCRAKDIVADRGIAAFCDLCRGGVMLYADEWRKYIARIGRWVDFGDNGEEYITMDTNYMESVIWALKELYDRGLIFQDYKVNPFSWKLGTVVSNADAAKEYQDVTDDAVTVWFELSDGRRILAWTTTPWTLPGNSALAVNPKLTYAVMRDVDGREYIVAESRLPAYKKEFAKSEKVGESTGADLVGLKYKPLFDYYEKSEIGNQKSAMYTVIAADYVSDSDGTGIVHIAPAFGDEDFQAARAIDPKFPVIVNVDDYGNFTPDVADFAGENIFDATPKIIAKLKESGHLVKKEQYTHSYPFDDRTHTKLIYRATNSWYIDVPAIRDRLIENNKSVNWTSAGERFTKWIENARPWAISRNRFWGTPLPIWFRESTDNRAQSTEYKIFGSIKELEEFFGVKISDLHRPTLDKLERDGWKRIPDVLDCWFESGAMPFASLHYPFENADKFAATFPSDYIIEGVDQTRGWFYTLMVLATALFDKPAFMTVSANGLTLDENKRKMSKSLGNFEDPQIVFDTYGADAIRLYLLGSNFMKAEPVMIDQAGKVFNEPIKNILTPLWNAYHFFTLYANAGGVTAAKEQGTGTRNSSNILDQYILAELDDLTGVVRAALDEYKPDAAIRAFVSFLEILNNWYIRRSRERFWNEEQGAFDTLHFVLTEFCKLLAPFAPFISDYIYRNLTGPESVHLEKFPSESQNTRSTTLQEMRRVQQIVAVGKMLREKAGLRNRLPLTKITVVGSMREFGDIIRDELNVKTVEFSDDVLAVADIFAYLITPKIGARLGAKLKDIIADVKANKYKIEHNELVTAHGDRLSDDEYEMRLTVKPGITGAALPDNTAVVVLDTTITPELEAEGWVNDALRFIQDSRKEAGLDVSDRIVLEYSADADLTAAIEKHRDRIMADTLAIELIGGATLSQGRLDKGEFGTNSPHQFSTEIEGHKFGIKITKAK